MRIFGKNFGKGFIYFEVGYWTFLEGCTLSPKITLRAAMYTRKALYPKSRVTTNSFFLISSTCLVVESMSLVIQDLHYKSWAWKLISVLLIVRKDIASITSGLTLANKKLFSKNLSLLSLFDMEKMKTTIL